MPKPTKGPRLGGSPAHERIILDNLASQLFEHGRVKTTETKAKRVRPLAEKLITKAKRGDLHSVRLAAKHVRDKDVLYTLFHEIAPLMEGRDGGYTRITKLAPRKGDNAPMALIEIIDEPVQKKEKAPKADPQAKAPSSEDIAKAVEDAEVADPEHTESDEVTEEVESEETAADAAQDEASEAEEAADSAEETADEDKADEEKAAEEKKDDEA